MNRITKLILMLVTLVSIFGCTDIEENVYDKYYAAGFYASDEGAEVALASVYAQIPGNWDGVGYAGADNGWYDLNSMSTDEQVIPHRNTGDWQLDFAKLYLREWLPSDFITTNTWNWLYNSVYAANLAIDQLETANADSYKIAEAHTLRAFFYYLIIDDYGNVPFYTSNTMSVDQIPQVNRKEVFDFIVDELEDNVDKLTSAKGGAYYGRFNKWAGYTILAKLYLNAEVYTGTAMWDECLEVCNKIISEGGFSLHSGTISDNNALGSDYYDLFSSEECPGDETILAIPVTVDVVGRNILAIRSVGGADGSLLFGYTGWNGSIIPPDYFEMYDENDVRIRQFRYGSDPYGPQPDGFIEYTKEITSLDDPGAGRNEGIRSLKFFPAGDMNGGGASNDFPIYRYADILLMKAECLIHKGDASSAKTFVDQIRERAGLESLAANPTLDDIYKERTFELNLEGHRRQDMIRFGTFTKAHGLAPAVDDHYELFPIPTSARNANPNLEQNTGF